MGVNSPNQQQPQGYNPQAMAMNAMARNAATPYQGSAPGGGAANAVSQLASALMAKQRMQEWQQKNGVPTYNSPTAQPGAVTPGMGGFPMPPGQAMPQTMNAQPMMPAGAPYA